MSPLNDRLDALTHKLIHKNNVEGLGLNGNPVTLGYAERRADTQVASSTFIDVPGMSVTVTVPAGRMLKITVSSFVYSTVANDAIAVRILEDGAKIKDLVDPDLDTTQGDTIHGEVVTFPAAGTHTYKVQISRLIGSGAVNFGGRTDNPAILLVEDITGNQLPYNPLSVPVGLLAQTYNFGNGFTFTTLVAIPNSGVTVVVPAGRTIRVRGKAHLYSSVSNDRLDLIVLQDGTSIPGAGAFHTIPTSGIGNDVWVEAILSPTAGAHTYSLAVKRDGTGTGSVYSNPAAGDTSTFITVEDITATPAPANGAPSSTLGYAEVLADQSGITTEVDATGLAVTVTVPAGRRLRISLQTDLFSSVSGDVSLMYIKDGSTILERVTDMFPGVNVSVTHKADVIVSPSAGTHTYKATVLRASGSGNVTLTAASGRPAYLLVEDITGTTVTGMVASEPWLDWVPTWTNLTIGNGTVQAKYVKIGRTVQFRLVVTLGSTSTVGTDVYFTLPVTAAASDSPRLPIGHLMLEDITAANWFGQVWQVNTTQGRLLTLSASAPPIAQAVSATYPSAGWATGDRFSCSGSYEAMS